MIRYLLPRLAYYLSIFLGIILFSFILFHIIPSDPARAVLGPNAEQPQVERLRQKLGLDQPLYVQIFRYLREVAAMDFGHSYVDDRNVFHEVTSRLKITLSLIAISMMITFVYIFLVILSFLLPSLLRFSDLVDFFMSSLPVFFSGIIVAILTLYFYPVTSFSGDLSSLGDVLFLIPPAMVLSFYPMAILSGILKEELSSVLRCNYIMAERSWGFSEMMILFRYALKNTLMPLLSTISNILPILLTGAFIVEIIFSIPAIGSLLVKSILERDFPMIECIVIINGAFFVLVNLGFETIYPLVDPRIVRGGGE